MGKMRKVISLMMVAAMGLSMAACGGSAESTSNASGATGDMSSSGDGSNSIYASALEGMTNTSEPTYGGSATFYYLNFNEAFDPAVGESYTYAMWLEPLWTADWGLNDPDTFNFDSNVLPYEYITGQIADSWEWELTEDASGDVSGSDLTVKIRDDVYFQDKSSVGMGDYDVYGGRQLTAEDVKWTYDRLTGIDGAEAVTYEETMWDQYMYMLDSVEVVDDLTVKFNFNTDNELAIKYEKDGVVFKVENARTDPKFVPCKENTGEIIYDYPPTLYPDPFILSTAVLSPDGKKMTTGGGKEYDVIS